MTKTPPRWKKGDNIYGKDINNLSQISHEGAVPFIVNYQSGHGNAFLPMAPIAIEVLIITEIVDVDLKTYKGRPMWYNDGVAGGENSSATDTSWNDNTDFNDFDIDGASTETTLAVDDQVVAYYHDQRNAWIPMAGGGGEACTPQNAIIQITIFGKPTGGTFTMDLEIDTVIQTLTFNFDDTAAEVATELLTHVNIIAATDIIVTAGPFPNATMEIEFTGALANTPIRLPTFDWDLLTGGSGDAGLGSHAQLGIS